jgi:hypothetical protein
MRANLIGNTDYSAWLCWLVEQSYLVNFTIRLVVLAMLAMIAVLAVYGVYAGYANFTSLPFSLALRSKCAGG